MDRFGTPGKMSGIELARRIFRGEKPQDKDGNEFVIVENEIYIKDKDTLELKKPNWTPIVDEDTIKPNRRSRRIAKDKDKKVGRDH